MPVLFFSVSTQSSLGNAILPCSVSVSRVLFWIGGETLVPVPGIDAVD
jgi:hypothetical protein